MQEIRLFLSRLSESDISPDAVPFPFEDDKDLLYEIGEEYFTGRRGIKNLARAFRYYEIAAGFGHAGAAFNLGCMYYSGIYVRKDYHKARDWFLEADKAGHVMARTMLEKVEALLLRDSAELLSAVELRNLGLGYMHASHPDYSLIRAFLEKASEEGDAESMYHLGIMAEKGQTGPPDNTSARFWYLKAAKKGFAKAYLPLSDFCFYGTGGSVDYAMALLWAEKGALLPDAYLMYRAGYMYEKGLGCSQNLIHARSWYQKAANLGNANAGKRLKIVSRRKRITKSVV